MRLRNVEYAMFFSFSCSDPAPLSPESPLPREPPLPSRSSQHCLFSQAKRVHHRAEHVLDLHDLLIALQRASKESRVPLIHRDFLARERRQDLAKATGAKEQRHCSKHD